MFRFICISICILFLIGCSDSGVKSTPVVNDAKDTQRFQVSIVGRFDAGYKDNRRDILILKDTLTEKTYLAVTGCGVTEMIDYSNGGKHRNCNDE